MGFGATPTVERRSARRRRRRLASGDNEDEARRLLSPHACPLCRERVWIADSAAGALRVNGALQSVAAALFPDEAARAASPDKRQPAPAEEPVVDLTTTAPSRTRDAASDESDDVATDLASFRRHPSLRSLSSLVSVSLASLYTVPPGFVLAVMLLAMLAAVAWGPQTSSLSASASTTMLTLEAADRLCNALARIIRDVSLQMDYGLDQLYLALHLVAVVLR